MNELCVVEKIITLSEKQLDNRFITEKKSCSLNEDKLVLNYPRSMIQKK